MVWVLAIARTDSGWPPSTFVQYQLPTYTGQVDRR
jgi:hypothetical protein